ncbi:unnamed protein product [Cuscuta epithymum]|nr:unnamed protein product [Cuscuta epithymum]
MPNFNIFGFESQKESEEGNQEKLRPENDIEDDTEMEEHGEENETEDCKKEEEKIGEKEQEASTEVEEQREEIQTEVNNQEGQKGVVNDEKQMTNDATSYDMWGMGSQENSQFVKELCNSVDLIEKEALLRKSEGKPPTNIPTVLREKRIAKSPTRYTPAGQTADAKRRRKEKAKKRTHEEFLPPSRKIYGPFSEDPTDTPPADQMQRLANFLSIGMLKYRKKAEKDRRYRADEENMHGIPMLLDIMKIESKTWLYNLYSNEQWLNDQHMEVGMYYLSVKRLQYKLKQQYATNRAFFIQILRREHEKILKGQGTVHEAADDDEIMHSVQGSTSKFALHWCDCQFVYFPLNTGQHWVLLVLDIKNRKVRVYNSSSRRGDSLKDIRPFIPCIKVLLPKIMDYYNVHANSGEEPMGGKELQIEAVESCPQQTNAGDCGMFVLKIAEFLIMDMELDGIDADEMPMFRQKMATELVMYSEKRMSEAKGVQMPKFIRE